MMCSQEDLVVRRAHGLRLCQKSIPGHLSPETVLARHHRSDCVCTADGDFIESGPGQVVNPSRWASRFQSWVAAEKLRRLTT